MTLEEEELIFHYELGQCLTQWAWVERTLCYAAVSCTAKRHERPLLDGYFAIENFRSKMAFIDRLVCRATKDVKLQARWEAVLSRVDATSKFRNKLVHRSIVIYEKSAGGRRVRLMRWADYLDDKWKSKSQANSDAQDAIVLVDLAAFQNTCYAVWRTLVNVNAELAGKLAPLPKGFEQEFDRMTAADIERRYRVRSGRQPKPLRGSRAP